MVIWRSSGRYQAAPRAFPRGTIVTFTSGLACSSIQLKVAWPASCVAMLLRSLAVRMAVCFSKPPTMRSTAFIKSSFCTNFLPARAAIRAASLQTLAMSAPEKPGVWRAKNSESTVSSILIGRKCTRKISLRSFRSGSSTWICRSKRPARSRALSSMSARLVAARMMTPLFEPKPSISVSNWLRVFSRSSLLVMLALRPRARPMASISSIKMIQGDFSLA